MPRGSHAPGIDSPPRRMVQYSGESYSQGIEVFERDQVPRRVCGVAKTVAACLKHRSAIGLDVALCQDLPVHQCDAFLPGDDWRMRQDCFS